MGSQKVVNSPLGSYPVLVDRNSTGSERQAVGIDFGAVSGDVLTESRVSSANPLPVTPFATGSLSAGNVISSGLIAAATIDAAGVGGSILIDYNGSDILAVNFFNGLTSVVEVTFDGASTWITLYAGASPSIEFGDKGRKITGDVKVRKSGATTVTGGSIMAWGTT